MKMHTMYGAATMRRISFLFQLRPLLSETKCEKAMRRLQSQVENLQKRNPNKLGGKQAYAKEFIAKATEMEVGGHDMEKQYSKSLIRSHNAAWHRMPSVKQAHWRAHAEELQEEARVANAQKLEGLVAQIGALRQQAHAEAQPWGVVRASSLRLSLGALWELAHFVENYDFTDSAIARVHEEACNIKGRPPQHVV